MDLKKKYSACSCGIAAVTVCLFVAAIALTVCAFVFDEERVLFILFCLFATCLHSSHFSAFLQFSTVHSILWGIKSKFTWAE